jgi:hypothetical protein
MAADADDDKTTEASQKQAGRIEPARPESRDSAPESLRSPFGPRPLSALLPALVRPAFRGRTAATAQVLADWPAIVGPAFAPLTTPQRLSAGTLTIACSGPMAMELQHVAPVLIERINSHLGRVAVIRLRFVQTFPARAKAAAPPASPPAGTAAPEAAFAAVADKVAVLPAGELRDALERLGRAMLSRSH